MNILRWLIGAIIIVAVVALIVLADLGFPSYLGAGGGFVARAVYVLILASLLCLFRVLRGPTAADRIVATDIFGILVVGFCAVVSVATGRSWYIDIGIAWALQSFIGALALSKYLEGKAFDE